MLHCSERLKWWAVCLRLWSLPPSGDHSITHLSMNPVNKMKFLAARAFSGNPYHRRIHTTPTPTPALAPSDSLKFLEPLIQNLKFLEPLAKFVIQVMVFGVAAWKFHSSSLEVEEYMEQYFKYWDRQIQLEEDRAQLMKELVATHKAEVWNFHTATPAITASIRS